MTTIENELSVAKRFHALVSVYDRRPAMARRNILPILIRFTRSTDRELRYIAIDCILLLSQHPQSAAALLKYPVLEATLKDLLRDTEMDDPELHNLISIVLHQLASPPVAAPASRLSSLSSAGDVLSSNVSSPEPSPQNPVFSSNEDMASPDGSPWIASAEHLRRWAGEMVPPGEGGMHLQEVAPSAIAGSGPLGAVVSRRLPPPIHALQQQAQFHPKPRGQEDFDHTEEEEDGESLKNKTSASIEGGATSLTRVAGFSAPTEPSVFYQNINRDGVGLDSPHMVTFYVPHLYPRTNTSTLEHILQAIKGVISYHLYPADHQIRVYMICKPQLVQQALEQQAMLRSSILQDELLLLDSARTPSLAHPTRSANKWSHWGRRMAIATKLVAQAERLRGKTKKDEKATPVEPMAAPLSSSLSGFRIYYDPTATRHASLFHLAQAFLLKMFKTARVYSSPCRSTVEARVAWQRECLELEQQTDSIGGAASRYGEWCGKILAKIW